MSEKKRKRDNTFCCVPQCNSKGSRNPDVSFHTFPNEKFKLAKTCAVTQRKFFVTRKQEWARLIRTGKKITPRMKVCSKHFKEDDYNLPVILPNATGTTKRRLKRNAVPSMNLPKWPSEIEKMETPEKEKGGKRSRSNLKVLKNKKTKMSPVSYEEEEIRPITDERLYEEFSDPNSDDNSIDAPDNISYNSNEAVQISHLEKDANMLPGINEEISRDIFSDDEEINLIGNESPKVLKQKFEKLSAHHKKLKRHFKESQELCKRHAKEIDGLKTIIHSLEQIIKVSNDI